MRRRDLVQACLVLGGAALLVVTLLVTLQTRPDLAMWAHQPGRPDVLSSPSSASDTPTLSPPADPAGVTARDARLFGWALVDRRTGRVSGSPNSATVTNTVESMIKPWIAADYLRRLAAAGREPTPAALAELTRTIVDSNDPLTEKYYRLGGADAVVARLVSVCGLVRVKIKSSLWSWTEMTPQDAARYGVCLGDGRAAGPRWTAWILDTMKKVRGEPTGAVSGAVQGGRWGIIDGLPPELARETSIKNGWTSYEDGWHVNCLAVHPDWVLTVMIRTTKGLRAAAENCRAVATRLAAGG